VLPFFCLFLGCCQSRATKKSAPPSEQSRFISRLHNVTLARNKSILSSLVTRRSPSGEHSSFQFWPSGGRAGPGQDEPETRRPPTVAGVRVRPLIDRPSRQRNETITPSPSMQFRWNRSSRRIGRPAGRPNASIMILTRRRQSLRATCKRHSAADSGRDARRVAQHTLAEGPREDAKD
jgi:hypothetical protein